MLKMKSQTSPEPINKSRIPQRILQQAKAMPQLQLFEYFRRQPRRKLSQKSSQEAWKQTQTTKDSTYPRMYEPLNRQKRAISGNFSYGDNWKTMDRKIHNNNLTRCGKVGISAPSIMKIIEPNVEHWTPGDQIIMHSKSKRKICYEKKQKIQRIHSKTLS